MKKILNKIIDWVMLLLAPYVDSWENKNNESEII